MTCYLEGLGPEWEHSHVRLPTDVSDTTLSSHTQQLLTVPRAIVSEDGVLLVNPLQYFACESGGGFMTVLRAFRLVRLFKFMRALPELQAQIRKSALTAVRLYRKCTRALTFQSWVPRTAVAGEDPG